MNKKQLVAGFLIIFLLVATVVIKQSLTFHVVSTVPRNGSKTNQYTEITLKFNRNLSTKPGNNYLSVSPNIGGRSIINGKEITFIPIASYSTSKEYTVSLSNIVSDKGDKLKDVQINFTPIYVAYKDLPKEVQDRLVRQTDVNADISAPYSAAVIAIAGTTQLINHGVADRQISNLQTAFYKYFQSTSQEVRGVTLSNVNKLPHDPSGAGTSDAINFIASWKGAQYFSRFEYSLLNNTVRLYLYKNAGGSLIYDSGSVTG